MPQPFGTSEQNCKSLVNTYARDARFGRTSARLPRRLNHSEDAILGLRFAANHGLTINKVPATADATVNKQENARNTQYHTGSSFRTTVDDLYFTTPVCAHESQISPRI
jgi:hypothetical protein